MTSFHHLHLKRAAALLCAVMLLAAMTAGAFAEEQTPGEEIETVRLGYFSYQNYLMGAEEDAEKSGYAYDLLCEIAYINNWRYEFVYGDFNVLYQQLINGEIDILPCLVYTEERAAAHLFSDEEIYNEQYFISALNEKAARVSSLADLNGKTICTVSDCNQNEVFEDWAAENGISMEQVYTPSFDEC